MSGRFRKFKRYIITVQPQIDCHNNINNTCEIVIKERDTTIIFLS